MSLNKSKFRKLIELGKKKGVLTYDEIDDALPHEGFSVDDMDNLLEILGDMGIEVVESDGKARATEKPPEEKIITPYKKGDFIGQKYEVYDILGMGGFGIVYLVYSHKFKSVYALMTFREEYIQDKEAQERFKKEAKIWIDLERHPYLVRAFFVDEISGRLFIELEYIAPGEDGFNSLDGYLRYKPPDIEQSLRWGIQFCHGMEYAYSKGIRAHRDIKPANILIGVDKAVKITDFGIAGVIGNARIPGIKIDIRNNTVGFSCQTAEGRGFGTPTHMPPEQFTNAASCDERSDIYSFGIVLYQMPAHGNLPFLPELPRNNSDDEHIRFWHDMHRLHSQAPVLRLNSPLFPIIQKCLEEEPNRRYRSFKDLRTELEVILKRQTGEVFRLQEIEDMGSWEWNNKGVSLNSLRKYQEAIECFDKAINVNPLNLGAWNNKGTSLRFLDRKQEALSCCEEALKINPSNARALFNKSALLSELGQLDDALQCINQALGIKPVDLYLISQIGGLLSVFEPVNIKALCEKIVRLNLKPYDRDGLYNLGLCYLQLEDIDNALRLFLETEKLDKDDSGIWFELMNIYYKKQSANNTIKYCDKLISAHKYYDEAVNKKSLVLFNTGKKQEAISLLKSVLSENDSFDYLWIQLSYMYEQVHDVNEALNAAKKCLQILNASKPKDSNKIAYVSKAIHDLSQKQANAGIPEIEQAIRNLKAAEIEYNKQKPHVDAVRRLIQLYLNDGDKEKALYYCEMLIKTTNYITDFGNKAVVMSYFGDYAGAVGLLTDILNEWPHVDSLWYVLSNIHEQHKNYSEALKAVMKCRDILLETQNPNRQNLIDVEQKIQILQGHFKR